MIVSDSRAVQHTERAAAADVTEIVTAAVAAETAALRAENEQLRKAMDSRATIEQARGMLMALASCPGEAAWPMLVEISQHSNVKLRHVAAALVAAATGGLLPPEIEPAYRDTLARARHAQAR
ncbi:ANTAR domain-containing protein [Streptomyces smyrnaeus]|uniref:ANTAR domain-containing protein n=1 Tax=Streptomyces smyrnaeus TaxID=1387713 RepID=UPI00368AF018